MGNIKYVKNDSDNRKRKTLNIILVGFIILFSVSIFLMLIDRSPLKSIKYDDLKNVINSPDYSLVILGREGCDHCMLYKPQVEEIVREYELNAYYLLVDDLSEDAFYNIHDSISALNAEYSSEGNALIPTPTTIIFKDGREVTSELGNIGRNGLLKILKESGVIEK